MSVTPVPAQRLPALSAWNRRLPAAWPAVALFMLSLVMPWHAGDNTDVSWLIVVCEKILDGQRLYVDILETNPPFSIALYFGPVWLADELGIAAELAVQAFVYLVFLAGLVLTVVVMRRGGLFDDVPSSWLYAALAFLMLILPGNVMGQREHIGMMLFMPMLAMMMWRAESTPRRSFQPCSAGGAGGERPHSSQAALGGRRRPALSRDLLEAAHAAGGADPRKFRHRHSLRRLSRDLLAVVPGLFR